VMPQRRQPLPCGASRRRRAGGMAALPAKKTS
jgi:hypothetical protein